MRNDERQPKVDPARHLQEMIRRGDAPVEMGVPVKQCIHCGRHVPTEEGRYNRHVAWCSERP